MFSSPSRIQFGSSSGGLECVNSWNQFLPSFSPVYLSSLFSFVPFLLSFFTFTSLLHLSTFLTSFLRFLSSFSVLSFTPSFPVLSLLLFFYFYVHYPFLFTVYTGPEVQYSVNTERISWYDDDRLDVHQSTWIGSRGTMRTDQRYRVDSTPSILQRVPDHFSFKTSVLYLWFRSKERFLVKRHRKRKRFKRSITW